MLLLILILKVMNTENQNVNENVATSVELTVNVNTIGVFPHSRDEESRLDVVLQLAEEIPNIVRTEDGGFEIGTSSVLRIDRAAFVAQAINVSKLFRRFVQRFDTDVIIGKVELGQLFIDSTITVKRKFVQADGLVVMHNRFETELVAIKFDELSVMLAWPELPESLVKRLLK